VGLERDPLSLVSTTEELLERESSGSDLENREYGHRDPSRWPCGTLFTGKLQLLGRYSLLADSGHEGLFLMQLTVLVAPAFVNTEVNSMKITEED
jgi:hypothetical protein